MPTFALLHGCAAIQSTTWAPSRFSREVKMSSYPPEQPDPRMLAPTNA
jgi:hypothetical protein